ncbi:ABC-F family ATP-binding cassette domain-containing protein [Sedimentibacter sp. zth1]|uniref:ABC-F family ATP-binding cassette domain-containing protein n=1 Tax=Sedimentibacter sp. zth1 TaxID=2816908 RepID=UPI001A924119|nr:ABC-F family ATP-binding cassette domain-containing protein [Sedimentibacter sp. zth1]QSX07009.1 ABC-F family ATP-binding cassette domain-containing protein [Sedimentibacter sp. zth1]
MIILSCNNISKAYVVDNIIENISFTINDDERVGLIGINGAGKTTLFNILTKELEYDSGDIIIPKNKKIAYLKQNTKIESKKTIYQEMLTMFDDIINMESKLRDLENEISKFTTHDHTGELDKLMDTYSKLNEEFDHLNGYGYESQIRGVLNGLSFSEEDFEKPINILSGGQKTRVMLAKLLLEKADILLLDEPTNHLDITAISWLEKYLRDFKGAVIIISHDRYFLDNTVNRILLLENKNIKSYNGTYSQFMQKRKLELEQQIRKFENFEKEVQKQEEMINRLHAYGSKRNIRQAFSRQKALDKMKKVEKPILDSRKVNLRFTPKLRSGIDVLKVENLSKSYNNKNIFDDISFNVYRGEKVGIIGPNGIGKSTILKIIAQKINEFLGIVTPGHFVNIGYYDQEQTHLDNESTIIDEIWDDNPKFNYYDVRSLLAQFLFTGDDLYKIIADLSGGEKGRLSLLKLMLSEANFLLMDEPTNHLDIDSKEILEDALINYDGTILVVSHDRYFLNKVTTKIIDMSTEGIFEYLGNYNYYIEKKAELEQTDEEIVIQKTKTQINAERKKEKELNAVKKKKDKEIKDLEISIEKHENDIAEIETQLCDTEIYEDTALVLEINNKLKNLNTKLEELYDTWSTLNE